MDMSFAGALSVAESVLFFELFLRAHIAVKITIIILILSSVRCWAIIFEKLILLGRINREADKFETLFWSAHSLDEFYSSINRSKPPIATAALFIAAMREWNRSVSVDGGSKGFNGIQTRVEKVMDVTITREIDRLKQRLLFLATVGTTAPFIGLLGTVWGIIISLQGIEISEGTNLAVIAPGISEALFASAIGLITAIPAVLFYNKFSGDVSRLSQRLEAFADEFSAIVSRQVDTTHNS
ncbi:MAG: Tol-Pal system protein TolQ [Hyphomicrobiaceae bacterium hypho_1]